MCVIKYSLPIYYKFPRKTEFPVLTIAFPIAPIHASFSSKVFASKKKVISSVITFYLSKQNYL